MHTVGPWDDCMTMQECAEYLKKDPITFRGCYLDKWKVPFTRIGGAVWFRKCEVDDWIEQQRRNAAQPWRHDLGAPMAYPPRNMNRA